jgi:hypothetical protein
VCTDARAVYAAIALPYLRTRESKCVSTEMCVHRNMCPQKCSGIFVNIKSCLGMKVLMLQHGNGSGNAICGRPLQPNISVGLVLEGQL